MNPNTYSPWKNSDELIQLREGFKDHWYKDSLGIWTGGWGHKRLPNDPDEFNVAIAKDWYKKDSLASINAASMQVSALPWNTYWLIDVLRSVNFQLGVNWINIHTKTWALMQAGKFYDAAIEAQNSKWFSQTPVRVQDLQAALIYTQACYDRRKG